ncbi:MAG: MerC domain-containing protein [Pseudomonadota bacterium]
MAPKHSGEPRSTDRSGPWDLLAAGLSSLCVLHCLGLPVLAAVFSVAAMGFDAHELHLVMVAFAVPISLRVVWLEGWADSRAARFSLLVVIGLALLISALIFASNERAETVLTLAGGSVLASAHIWRWRRDKKARRDQDQARMGELRSSVEQG